MVTSGVVPGLVACQMLADALLDRGDVGVWSHGHSTLDTPADVVGWLCLAGFFITAASGYRLAKFNIDTRQTDSFIGLPTPANALLIISLGVIAQSTTLPWLFELLTNIYFLLILIALSCYLLNAELPLFALKFKTWGFKENVVRYLFILFCVALIVALNIYAIPIIILMYVLVSVFMNVNSKTTSKR
jgi:CDP-diacylglycerol--serine O-phosphatidyltransferase